MPHPPNSRRAFLDTALIVAFLGAMAAPTVDCLVRPDLARGTAPERRTAAERPEWVMKPREMTKFPERFKSWFDDSFGLRDVFLRWNSIVKVFLLHVSPSPDLVLGLDGWWLYRGFGALDDWRGVVPFAESELEEWRSILEGNRDLLRERGVEYLFVIGPNKETIYPEKVPGRLNRVGPTRLDQLLAFLERRSDLRILDLRPALLAAKAGDAPDDELYFRNGTHWSARGEMVAYRELVARLAATFPAIEPVDPASLEKYACPDSDSWAPTMYIGDLIPPSAMRWRFRDASRARLVQSTGPAGHGGRRITEVEDARLPSAVFFHDSFGLSIQNLVAESFGRLDSRSAIDPNLLEIDREQPDVFIQLYVERSLVAVPRKCFRIRAEDSERGAFDHSSRSIFRFPRNAGADGSIASSELRIRTPADAGADGLEARTDRPWFVLPELELPADTDIVVAVDLTAPAATQAILLDVVDDRPDPVVERRKLAAVDIGRNRLYLRLDPRSIRGRLAVRPGMAPGPYRLHEVEIRCVERADPAAAK